jgi:hypothetical protein
MTLLHFVGFLPTAASAKVGRKSKTKNQKSKIKNQKSKTKNQKSKTLLLNSKPPPSMSRYLLSLLLLCIGLVASAQPPPPGEGDWMDRSERVRAQRVAYLTQRLQLTPV